MPKRSCSAPSTKLDGRACTRSSPETACRCVRGRAGAARRAAAAWRRAAPPRCRTGTCRRTRRPAAGACSRRAPAGEPPRVGLEHAEVVARLDAGHVRRDERRSAAWPFATSRAPVSATRLIATCTTAIVEPAATFSGRPDVHLRVLGRHAVVDRDVGDVRAASCRRSASRAATLAFASEETVITVSPRCFAYSAASIGAAFSPPCENTTKQSPRLERVALQEHGRVALLPLDPQQLARPARARPRSTTSAAGRRAERSRRSCRSAGRRPSPG